MSLDLNNKTLVIFEILKRLVKKHSRLRYAKHILIKFRGVFSSVATSGKLRKENFIAS